MEVYILMKKSVMIMLIIIVSVSLTLSGCAAKNDQETKISKVSIAEQFGLAYAPLQVMKELKLLEKNLPGVEITWKQLGNTAAIREAMVAQEVDVGFMAIPPFLIGWDKGMEWKIFSGLSKSPVGLVVNNPNIRSIKDFTDKDRIAVPQPGSVQHILLSMACEREFGNPKKLDNQLITLAHPDGMNALLAKNDITAHFTAPPYLTKELETEGMHQILSGSEAMGKDFTFIVGVSTSKFHDKNIKEYKALIKSLNEAMEYMKENKKETQKLLSKAYEMSEADIENYMSLEGVNYDSSVAGVHEFAEFMKRSGYISKVPQSINDILWEDVDYEK